MSRNLAPLVDELIRLEREVAEREREIADIKARFITAAEDALTAEDVKTPNFIGCSYEWLGTDGSLARVTFPEPRLISSFQLHEGKAFRWHKEEGRIEMPGFNRAVGQKFDKLFATYYKPCKGFREIVPKLLLPGSAEALLKLCTEPSSPRVTTQIKEVVP